jgi:hypothetical protein
MVMQYTQPYKILFNPYQIKDQCLIKEHIFNDDFKTDIIAGKLKPNVDLTSPTNYIHFIWIGQKPFFQTQFTKNLIGINNFFKDKQLVLWGEIFDEETKRFCEENNILLLNHKDLLIDADPDVIKLHNIHKKLVPSNEGARSDILRLLIMQKCGGIYCDIDNEANEKSAYDKQGLEIYPKYDEKSDDFAVGVSGNDVMIAREAKDEIIGKIFKKMIENEQMEYSEIKYLRNIQFTTLFSKSTLVNRTLIITGPGLLNEFEKAHRLIYLFKTNSAQSWINGIGKYISQNKNLNIKEEKDLNELEDKIVYSVLYEMHYRGRLNIARFQPIFDICIKYPKMKKNIINRLLIEIKKKHYHEDFIGEKKKFKEVIAYTQEDYLRFKSLSEIVEGEEEKNNFVGLKKAIKSNNTEMIQFYLEREIKINEFKLSQLLLHALKNNNIELTNKLIEKYGRGLDLDNVFYKIAELYIPKLFYSDDNWLTLLSYLDVKFKNQSLLKLNLKKCLEEEYEEDKEQFQSYPNLVKLLRALNLRK